MFSVALSGTPAIKSPAGVFHSIRMMDTNAVPTISDFNNCYVKSRDRWGNVVKWHNLEHFAERISPIVHVVDRDDPRVKSQFPVMMPREVALVDLDPRSQKLYDILMKEYGNIETSAILDYTEILSAIGVFQMICSNPRSVLLSARQRQEYEDEYEELEKSGASIKDLKLFKKRNIKGSAVALKLVKAVGADLFGDRDTKGNCTVAKMLELRDRIEHHDDKVLVFTSMNDTLLPLIGGWLDKWNIPFVMFHGSLTDKHKQEALDQFRERDDIKVFLSSDAGSTSIDLPQASLKIDYDLPWSWAALKQRDRHDRIDSVKDVLYNVTLAVPGTVEERKAEIIDEKHKFHQVLFGGQDVEEEEVLSARAGLLYVLTGEVEPATL